MARNGSNCGWRAISKLHGEVIGTFGFIGGQAVDLDGLLLLDETTFGHAIEYGSRFEYRSERHGRIDGRLDIVL